MPVRMLLGKTSEARFAPGQISFDAFVHPICSDVSEEDFSGLVSHEKWETIRVVPDIELQ